MKLTGKKAEEYRQQFTDLYIGQSFLLDSPLPGLDATKAQAFLQEKTEDWWLFELFFLGIRFGKVTAEFKNNTMEFEQL